MTRDDIERMAKEAGAMEWGESVVPAMMDIEKFAALVAAEKKQQMIRDGWRQCAEGQRTTQYCRLLDAAVRAEREACAKVCEEQIKSYMSKKYTTDPLGGFRERFAAEQCAAAIRARGEV